MSAADDRLVDKTLPWLVDEALTRKIWKTRVGSVASGSANWWSSEYKPATCQVRRQTNWERT